MSQVAVKKDALSSKRENTLRQERAIDNQTLIIHARAAAEPLARELQNVLVISRVDANLCAVFRGQRRNLHAAADKLLDRYEENEVAKIATIITPDACGLFGKFKELNPSRPDPFRV